MNVTWRAPAPVDLGNVEPGQTATVQIAGGGEGGYTLTIATTAPGVLLLMVDTEEGARLRIDAGDAMLALVHRAGSMVASSSGSCWPGQVPVSTAQPASAGGGWVGWCSTLRRRPACRWVTQWSR